MQGIQVSGPAPPSFLASRFCYSMFFSIPSSGVLTDALFSSAVGTLDEIKRVNVIRLLFVEFLHFYNNGSQGSLAQGRNCICKVK